MCLCRAVAFPLKATGNRRATLSNYLSRAIRFDSLSETPPTGQVPELMFLGPLGGLSKESTVQGPPQRGLRLGGGGGGCAYRRWRGRRPSPGRRWRPRAAGIPPRAGGWREEANHRTNLTAEKAEGCAPRPREAREGEEGQRKHP